MAVDWDRIVELSGPATQVPANSMVPPGIPGRSDIDFSPRHDPAAAKALLADAGFPGGVGFPRVTLMTGGGLVDEAVRAQIREVLGVELAYETMDFGEYFDRLEVDPPPMWSLSWSADYPGRNDFLGLLLGTGQSNNYGRWSSSEFDAAIAEAGAAVDEAARRAAYDRAERIVQDQVPVIPAAYGTGWALARDGLLGAEENGLGILRLASLAWAP
jgi:oligopeptide transport system substrate-binding protein